MTAWSSEAGNGPSDWLSCEDAVLPADSMHVFRPVCTSSFCVLLWFFTDGEKLLFLFIMTQRGVSVYQTDMMPEVVAPSVLTDEPAVSH